VFCCLEAQGPEHVGSSGCLPPGTLLLQPSLAHATAATAAADGRGSGPPSAPAGIGGDRSHEYAVVKDDPSIRSSSISRGDVSGDGAAATASVVFTPHVAAADVLLPGEVEAARGLHLEVVAVADATAGNGSSSCEGSVVSGSSGKRQSCLGGWVAAVMNEHRDVTAPPAAAEAGGGGGKGSGEGLLVSAALSPLPLLSTPSPGVGGGTPSDDLLTDVLVGATATANGYDPVDGKTNASQQKMVKQQEQKQEDVGKKGHRLVMAGGSEEGGKVSSKRQDASIATAAAAIVGSRTGIDASCHPGTAAAAALVAEELGRLAVLNMALHGCCFWRSVSPTGAGFCPSAVVPSQGRSFSAVQGGMGWLQENQLWQQEATVSARHGVPRRLLMSWSRPSTLVEDSAPGADNLGKAAGAAPAIGLGPRAEPGACSTSDWQRQLLPVEMAAVAHLPLHCAVAWRLLGLAVAVDQRQ
jgi:hypothetical protein